jgi:hypothetical protein
MKELTRKVALLTALKDAVEAELDAARAEARDVIIKAREELGVKSVEVTVPDGEVVATVTVAGGGTAPSVHYDDVFLAWVKENHPSEVVESVRPSFSKALLGRLEPAGDRYVDPNTGEVVAGIGGRAKSEYISVRFKPAGREAIAEAWRGGEIGALLAGQPAIDNQAG